MGTIEGGNLEGVDRIVIETAEINIITSWMRSRSIKGMNTAVTTKVMFGDASIKRVSTQIVAALKQGKSRCGDDNMEKTFFITNRTITVDCC